VAGGSGHTAKTPVSWTAPAVSLAVLGLVVVLSMSPLVPVFGASTALRAAVGGAGGAAAVGLALRRLGLRPPGQIALICAGYVLIGTPAAVPRAALWGLLPSPDAIRLLVRGLTSAWKDVLTVDVPIGPGGGFAVAPFALAYLAVTAGWVGLVRLPERWRPAIALIPVLTAVTSLILRGADSLWVVAIGLTATCATLVWVAAGRESLHLRRVTASLAMIALVAGTTWGVNALRGRFAPEPLIMRDHISPPFDPSQLASPLAAFRHYARDLKDEELVSVNGLPPGQPVRLATMDAFDGIVWNVAGPESSGSGAFRRPAAVRSQPAEGDSLDLGIKTGPLGGVWLPTIGRPVGIVLENQSPTLSDSLRVNPQTNGAALPGGLPAELAYRQTGWVAEAPDQGQIMSAAAGSQVVPDAVGMPDSVPIQASKYTADAATAGEAALALAEGLRSDGYYSDGQATSGPAMSPAGHGTDRIDTLLRSTQMVGDCEQYASAMALMARSLGLSSRVVLGFAPASLTGAEDTAPPAADASGNTVFKGEDMIAWVEIDLENLGWVAFFPTPDKNKTPEQDSETKQKQPQPQQVPPPLPNPPPEAPPESDTAGSNLGGTDAADGPRARGWLATTLLVAGSVLLIILVAATPLAIIAFLKRRRRQRRLRANDPKERILGGWKEIQDFLTDLRAPIKAMATRLEQAEAAGEALGGPANEQLALLASAGDEAHFSPFLQTAAAAETYWSRLSLARTSIMSGRSRRERWRARASIRSLRRSRPSRVRSD
jgi:transglutaminase-like putative cysteine protease